MTFLAFGSGERPLEGGSVERSDLCLQEQRQHYPIILDLVQKTRILRTLKPLKSILRPENKLAEMPSNPS